MNIKDVYDGEIPAEYLNFLQENLKGCELMFSTSINKKLEKIDLFSPSELFENLEMNYVGSAKNFECLKLFIQFQRNPGYADIENPLSELDMINVENGLVIGGDYDGYLYLDNSDNDSVWIYFPENGHILKVADSFTDLIVNKSSTYTKR